jgi:hypothetical protein
MGRYGVEPLMSQWDAAVSEMSQKMQVRARRRRRSCGFGVESGVLHGDK